MASRCLSPDRAGSLNTPPPPPDMPRPEDLSSVGDAERRAEDAALKDLLGGSWASTESTPKTGMELTSTRPGPVPSTSEGASRDIGREHQIIVEYPGENTAGSNLTESEQWGLLKFQLDIYRKSVEGNHRMGKKVFPERLHFGSFCEQLACYCKEFCPLGAPDPHAIIRTIKSQVKGDRKEDSICESCPSLWRKMLQNLERDLQDISWAQMSQEEFWQSCSSEGMAPEPTSSLAYGYWTEHETSMAESRLNFGIDAAIEQAIQDPLEDERMEVSDAEIKEGGTEAKGEKEKNPKPAAPLVPNIPRTGRLTRSTFRTPPPPQPLKRRSSERSEELEGEELRRMHLFLDFLQAPKESYMTKESLMHIPQGA